MGLLNLADELRNVSQACRMMGVSRDTFYRVKEAKESGGLEALLHKDRRRSNLKNRVDDAVEQAVLAFALDNPLPGGFGCPTSCVSKECLSARRAFAPCGCVMICKPSSGACCSGEEIRRRRPGAHRTANCRTRA
jgi:hypothetical protein